MVLVLLHSAMSDTALARSLGFRHLVLRKIGPCDHQEANQQAHKRGDLQQEFCEIVLNLSPGRGVSRSIIVDEEHGNGAEEGFLAKKRGQGRC